MANWDHPFWDRSSTTITSRLAGTRDNIHLVFGVFPADLVTVPAPATFSSTALMTPVATDCLLSHRQQKGPEADGQRSYQHRWACQEPHQLSCITRRQEFGPRTTSNLLPQLSKLASNVSCVAIQRRCVASPDLAWMVQDHHPSHEASCFHWWVIFAVPPATLPRMNIFDRHVLDTEAHTVPRKSFTQSFTGRFNRVFTSVAWSKDDHHARGENTSLRSATRDSANTTNFVDVLEGQWQGLASWTSWWQDAIPSLKQHGSTGIAMFTGDFPSLEPRHVSTWLQRVVTIPTWNWHKCYCVGIESIFLM